MPQKTILSFMMIIALAHGARAGSFDRKNLTAAAARIEEEKRPGVMELTAGYANSINSLLNHYMGAIDLNSSDEDRLRALVMTFSDKDFHISSFDNNETRLSSKEQQNHFFRELGRTIAARIKAHTKPLLPTTDPGYRDAAVRGDVYDARAARNYLSFASALIAQVSNVPWTSLPLSYSFLPYLMAGTGSVIGLIFTLNPTIPWSVALPVDTLAVAGAIASLPRVGVQDWYRSRIAKRGAASFAASFLTEMNAADGTEVKTLAKNIANGEITDIIDKLCQIRLEPAAAPVAQVRINESEQDDAAEEAEAAAETETQAVGRRRL